MFKHIFLLFIIASSIIGCVATTPERDQDKSGLTSEEIIKQGGEITPERLAEYKNFDCEQIKVELTITARRFEHAATPRMIGGTIFVGGDLRHLVAIKALKKVANEKGCKVRSIDCAKYPLTCKKLMEE